MSQGIDYENLIIILYLFNRTKTGGGRMKTAKLLYLFEEKLYKNKIIGSTYIMKRYQMGPYDKNIAFDLTHLARNGFLKKRELYYDIIDENANVYYKNIQTTKFLKNIEELIVKYSSIFDELDMIGDVYGKMSGEELKNFVYSIPYTGWKNQRIDYYHTKEIIIDPKKVDNPKKVFRLDEDWYDTIELLLNPDLYYGLQESLKDAQKGKFSNQLS